jgi:hypothetical protein
MAHHFLRGKQAGIQNDLSFGVSPGVFMLDDVGLLPLLTLTTLLSKSIVCPLWNQFPNLRHGL